MSCSITLTCFSYRYVELFRHTCLESRPFTTDMIKGCTNISSSTPFCWLASRKRHLPQGENSSWSPRPKGWSKRSHKHSYKKTSWFNFAPTTVTRCATCSIWRLAALAHSKTSSQRASNWAKKSWTPQSSLWRTPLLHSFVCENTPNWCWDFPLWAQLFVLVNQFDFLHDPSGKWDSCILLQNILVLHHCRSCNNCRIAIWNRAQII